MIARDRTGLAERIVTNSLWGAIEFAWPLALALAATPFIVHRLGDEAYGVLALVSVAVGFLGVLELGVGGAAIRSIAEEHERGDLDAVGRTLGTILGFYAVAGLVGAILVGASADLIVTRVLDVPEALIPDARFAFYVAAPGFLVNLLAGALGSVPKALQRFDISTRVSVVAGTVNIGGMVAALALGGGLRGVVLVSLGVAATTAVASLLIAQRLLAGTRWSLRPDLDLLRRLLGFGSYFLLASASVALLYQLDRLLIGSFLGTAAVTYYVVPGNLAVKIQQFIATTTQVVFPTAAALAGTGRRRELLELYHEGTRVVQALAMSITVPIAILAGPFLAAWMGPGFAAESSTVMTLLAFTYFCLSLTALAWGISFGAGWARTNGLFALGIAAANVALFLVLVGPLGLVGAALAFLLSGACGAIALISYVERRLLGLPGYAFLKTLGPISVIGSLQAMLALTIRPIADGLVSVIICMIVVFALFPAGYFGLGFAREGDKRILGSLIRRLRGSNDQ